MRGVPTSLPIKIVEAVSGEGLPQMWSLFQRHSLFSPSPSIKSMGKSKTAACCWRDLLTLSCYSAKQFFLNFIILWYFYDMYISTRQTFQYYGKFYDALKRQLQLFTSVKTRCRRSPEEHFSVRSCHCWFDACVRLFSWIIRILLCFLA